MATFLLCLGVFLLGLGAARLLDRQKRQRRPTPPRPAVTPAMQQKMARTLTTLITSGGMQELSKARQMAKGYGLTRATFAALATPPEEDFARANLMGQFR